MKSNPFKSGVITALATPFCDYSLNLPALGDLMDYQMDNGVDGLLVLGTTGEASTVTLSEREEIIEFAVNYADKRIPIMAGCGSNDTVTACAFARKAEALGVDGILVVTPYYNKCNDDGAFSHFQAVASCVSLPVFLYNVPSRTGYKLSVDVLSRLSRIENIVAVKDACSVDNAIDCGFIEGIDLWCGDDALTLPYLSIGARGVISVCSNVAPFLMSSFIKAWQANDRTRYLNLHRQVKQLSDALFCDINPIPVKAALSILGLNAGRPRLPLTAASEDVIANVEKALKICFPDTL